MAGVDKQFVPIGGRPLLWHCLDALSRCAAVGEVALVLSERNLEAARDMVAANGWGKVTAVTTGGLRRQDSVRRGLDTLGPSDWVVVHDGARPFLDADLIARGLCAAMETGAAVAAVPCEGHDQARRRSDERARDAAQGQPVGRPDPAGLRAGDSCRGAPPNHREMRRTTPRWWSRLALP